MSLDWPIADHSGAHDAFAQLITRDSSWRFLPVRGPSETGKSFITSWMLGNALRIPELACGLFDFKGTTRMDAELRSFVQNLGVPMPPTGLRLNDCLAQILNALKQRALPALLVFDTYEVAGEAESWIKNELLTGLVRANWLRVVIAGQRVPEPTGAIWERVSSPIVELKPPAPADWFDYGKPHRPDLTFADVETACRLARNRATTLAQMFGPAS
jgi:hypothetical protein